MLESYPDYKLAIKEQQSFTYKLGQALIEANCAGGGANICLFAILQKSAWVKKRVQREEKVRNPKLNAVCSVVAKINRR